MKNLPEIEIDGIRKPIRFSYRALQHFSKLSGIKITHIAEIDLSNTHELLFAGLCAGAIAQNGVTDSSITLEKCIDFVDRDPSLFNKVIEIFQNDMAVFTKSVTPTPLEKK